MNLYCTIITENYLKYALTLHESIVRTNDSCCLYILIVDNDSEKIKSKFGTANLKFLDVNALKNSKFGPEIAEKYLTKADSQLRWALKPVLLNYLLDNYNDSSIIYIDPDIYFTGNTDYIFELLKSNSILLSPHNRSIEPDPKNPYLIATLVQGMYNAGFIGINKNSREFLNWWAQACYYMCEKNPAMGLFDDQKYLDLVPHRFKNCLVLEHEGINIAEWNLRTKNTAFQITDGKLLINNNLAIFFHLTTERHGTIEYLLGLKEAVLNNLVHEYKSSLQKHENELRMAGFIFKSKKTFRSKFKSFINKIRLRTRIRKFIDG